MRVSSRVKASVGMPHHCQSYEECPDQHGDGIHTSMSIRPRRRGSGPYRPFSTPRIRLVYLSTKGTFAQAVQSCAAVGHESFEVKSQVTGAVSLQTRDCHVCGQSRAASQLSMHSKSPLTSIHSSLDFNITNTDKLR